MVIKPGGIDIFSFFQTTPESKCRDTDSLSSSGSATPTKDRYGTLVGLDSSSSGMRRVDDDPASSPRRSSSLFRPENIPRPPTKLALTKAVFKAKTMATTMFVSAKKLGTRRLSGDCDDEGEFTSVCDGDDDGDDAMGPIDPDDQASDATDPAICIVASDPELFNASVPVSVPALVECSITRVHFFMDTLETSQATAALFTEPQTTTDYLLFVASLLYCPIWYALVGGCILLAPSLAGALAFGPGPVYDLPLGRTRSCYWIKHANRHVFVFLAVLLLLSSWWNWALCGLATVNALLCSHTIWTGFEVDESIPLGMDDRQTIFVILTMRLAGIGVRAHGDGRWRWLRNR